MSDFRTLISVDRLHALLGGEDLVILDGSWFLPNQARNAAQEFKLSHIPGAQFFDIDAVSDQQSSLPHMIPAASEFCHAVQQMGVSNTSRIVVYDRQGLFSAARVWWLFRLFGHQSIAVLDGGLPAWADAGYTLTDDHPVADKGTFEGRALSGMAVNLEWMQARVKNTDALILDARPAARFSGQAAEPRAGLSSGHMPGACSLPASGLIENGRLKPLPELQALFQKLGINRDSPVVTSCGSGVTAAIITLAMAHCGLGMHQLYDGSWTEWASEPGNAIVKGAESTT